MENDNLELQSSSSTTPIPDLFDTEPKTKPEEAGEAHVCDVHDDPPEEITGQGEAGEEKTASKKDDTMAEEYNQLREDLAAMSDRILSLEKLFDAKIMHSEHEKKIVDQMHRELQKYRDDMYARLVRPILMDVVAIRDSILRQFKEYSGRPEGERNIPLKLFETYAFDAEDILSRNDVEFYNSEEESDFVPVRQRAVKKVTTDDQSLHSKIAESIADGYSYNGKTISPEKVAVYVYEPTKFHENNEEESQNG